MDQHSLLLIARNGLAALPPDRLGELADWCWDFGEASADARYLILWRVFREIDAAFGRVGALETSRVEQINDLLRSSLPEIVAEDNTLEGGTLAATLRHRLNEL